MSKSDEDDFEGGMTTAERRRRHRRAALRVPSDNVPRKRQPALPVAEDASKGVSVGYAFDEDTADPGEPVANVRGSSPLFGSDAATPLADEQAMAAVSSVDLAALGLREVGDVRPPRAPSQPPDVAAPTLAQGTTPLPSRPSRPSQPGRDSNPVISGELLGNNGYGRAESMPEIIIEKAELSDDAVPEVVAPPVRSISADWSRPADVHAPDNFETKTIEMPAPVVPSEPLAVQRSTRPPQRTEVLSAIDIEELDDGLTTDIRVRPSDISLQTVEVAPTDDLLAHASNSQITQDLDASDEIPVDVDDATTRPTQSALARVVEAESQGPRTRSTSLPPPKPTTTPPVKPPASKTAPPSPPPATKDKKLTKDEAKRQALKSWFVDLFDEDYLKTLPFLTPQATQAEAQFVLNAIEAPPGAALLDVGCGYGRHAMEMASRGYHVVGLDLSLPLLVRGGEEALRRGLSINFVRGDMRELDLDAQFDAAYCLFSTFGYFDDETNKKTAANICRALKPGGKFVIEVLNRDYVVADLPTRVWWEGDGCVVLEEVDFNYYSSRIVVNRSIVFDDGRQVEQEISMRAYSLHEIGRVLHGAGFRVLEVSGSFQTRGRFFGNQSRHIVVLAERKEDR